MHFCRPGIPPDPAWVSPGEDQVAYIFITNRHGCMDNGAFLRVIREVDRSIFDIKTTVQHVSKTTRRPIAPGTFRQFATRKYLRRRCSNTRNKSSRRHDNAEHDYRE